MVMALAMILFGGSMLVMWRMSNVGLQVVVVMVLSRERTVHMRRMPDLYFLL